MSSKWQELLAKVREFEIKSPYNFCDRWCERCAVEKRLRCKLHHNELEQALTCIAHGKGEDDPEITQEVLERQYGGLPEGLDDSPDPDGEEEEWELDPEALEVPEGDLIRGHIAFVHNHPLPAIARTYSSKAKAFLDSLHFYDGGTGSPAACQKDLEVIAWYHVLLPAKIERGLAGFHEPADEDDFSLCDAVAQFEISRKAVEKSLHALRNVQKGFSGSRASAKELLALLHLVNDHIRILEETL